MSTTRLFAYGTLAIDPLFERVVGRLGAHEQALLPHHARLAFLREVYPGIVPRRGASTPGRLYHDVTEAELEHLDRFEGEQYRRERVVVQSRRQAVEAWTYVVVPQHRSALSQRPWDPEWFCENVLPRLLGSNSLDV